jgi:tetratricopeptide (TPR) repeat protein
MNRMLIALVLFVAFFSVPIRITAAAAQQPASTGAASSDTDLERRVYQLETAQKQTIESLRSSNDFNRFLIQMIGAIVALLVVTQTVIQGFAMRRQAQREREWDQANHQSVEQVSKVMDVVERTMSSRLDAEKEARREAGKTRLELEGLLKQIGALNQFYMNYQKTIENARNAIEGQAYKWTTEVSRHDFRLMGNELSTFAQQYDKFKTEYIPIEKEPNIQFSAIVYYILGIAAHYSNRPEDAKSYLREVIVNANRGLNEAEIDYNHRIATTHYYLGLIESNFGNYQKAIEYFENANKIDLQGEDYLTRIVIADAYIMTNDLDRAEKYIDYVEMGLKNKEKTEGRLLSHNLRLRSRAALIKASILMFKHEDNWQESAREILEGIFNRDPFYYYATAMLGQLCLYQGDKAGARKIFEQAYETIVNSGDLQKVAEIRSRILLLMVAGLCCRQGCGDDKRAEAHLDDADDLRVRLPKLGDQICTVFSIISRKNENTECIHSHIDLIRNGQAFVAENRMEHRAG